MAEDRVKIARIVGVHGVRGLLKLRLFLDDPDLFTEFSGLVDSAGKPVSLRLKNAHKGNFLAEMDGISDRTAAEALRGMDIFASRAELPEAGENEFYFDDLVGLAAVTPEGSPLGRIAAIEDYGAGPVVSLRLTAGGEALLPFSEACFPEIDIKAGRCTVVLPEGAV
jgi:16S rRNA processing protein RimM